GFGGRRRGRCPAMDLEKKPVVSDVGAWAMNVVSSVGIIMANKQLMSPNGYGFSFGTSFPSISISICFLFWCSVLNFELNGISKLSIIPVVCFMEFLLHSKHYSQRLIVAVAVVALGVGICTVTDVDINAKGLLCACTIGSFQKKYSIGSFELLSKTAPVQAVSLILVGPFADYYLNNRSLLEYPFSSGATVSSKILISED
ncbi:hypothetical protein BHM03_00007807, partial [Ensete ventricosum]